MIEKKRLSTSTGLDGSNALAPEPDLNELVPKRIESCVWDEWDVWGGCSATCGTGGYQTRSRSLVLHIEEPAVKEEDVGIFGWLFSLLNYPLAMSRGLDSAAAANSEENVATSTSSMGGTPPSGIGDKDESVESILGPSSSGATSNLAQESSHDGQRQHIDDDVDTKTAKVGAKLLAFLAGLGISFFLLLRLCGRIGDHVVNFNRSRFTSYEHITATNLDHFVDNGS